MSAAGSSAPRPSLDDIKAELAERAPELAHALMGAPNADTARRSEWRWGGKGSAAFIVRDGRGKRRGSFFSHETSEGGSALDFIMHARGCQVADAIRWATHWLGYDQAGYVPQPISDAVVAERARKRAEQEQEAAAAVDERIAYANKLWDEAVPVSGTSAESYLVNTRRIPTPPLDWPWCVRFHPRSRSLIVAATTEGGAVTAVQRVFITPDGRKIDADEQERRNLPAIKQTSGSTAGAVVRLPARTLGTRLDAPVLLAEGPESAMSAWISTGHETWAICGGLKNVPLKAGRRHVICRDDDKRHSPADMTLRRLAAAWRGEGHAITIATPWQVRRFDKSDMNDTLQAHGAHAVQARIERALRVQATAVHREPIELVRERLDEVIRQFFEDAAAWGDTPIADDVAEYDFPDGSETIPGDDRSNAPPPPAHAVKVEVGAGKSRSAYHYAAQMLARMRAAGDKRSIAVAVPTHRLGDEQVGIFHALANRVDAPRAITNSPGVTIHSLSPFRTARVWRGLEAVDPDHADAADDSVPLEAKTRMCRNLDAARDAQAAHADLFSSACQRLVDGERISCPFFGECGYQQQREAAADLWIVPHELLFLTKPKALGKLAALVVDESAWADGLEGVHGKPTALPIEDLRQPATIIRKGNPNPGATDRLAFLRSSLADVLEQHANGPLMREVLADFNLTSSNAGEAFSLEWQRFVDPGLHPRMTPEQRKEAVAAARGNAQVMRLARVWKALQALLAEDGPTKSGWLALASEPDDKDGSVRQTLHMKGRRDVKRGWQVPTLLLDATMDVDLVRPYWPHVEIVAQLLAEAPHQHVRQVIDRAFSKSMLDPIRPEMADTDPHIFRLLKADPKAPERREKNLRRVHAILCREARRYAPERVLIVCQKRVKEALGDIGPMPLNVELAHHNAVAGRDEWGPQPGQPGVRALIVVGRTMPTIGAVERLAEALSGIAVEDATGGWYERADAIREGLNGQAEAVETERHPNHTAEAVRWQICEGELVQIIGRGRGVNRTADNPLDVLVLTDAPIPVPVAETLSAADLDPTPEDMMAGAGGVVLPNPGQAAAAYPFLWSNREAAKKALQRRLGTSLYKKVLLIEECPQPRDGEILGAGVAFQVAGPGQKPAEAWFDPFLIPDIASWLTGHLGPLAWCRVEGPPEPEPAAAKASTPSTLPPDVEELSMPSSPTVPAQRLDPGLEPAAVYPVATDPGWCAMAPIVSFITVSGRSPRSGGHARHPIGCANIRAVREEEEMLWRGSGLPPPDITLPAEWIADAQEDVGGPHQHGRAA